MRNAVVEDKHEDKNGDVRRWRLSNVFIDSQWRFHEPLNVFDVIETNLIEFISAPAVDSLFATTFNVSHFKL